MQASRMKLRSCATYIGLRSRARLTAACCSEALTPSAEICLTANCAIPPFSRCGSQQIANSLISNTIFLVTAPLAEAVRASTRVMRQALSRQEVVSRFPPRQRGHAAEPGMDGGMAGGEIVAVLVAGIMQIGHHRDVGDRRPCSDRECVAGEMSFQDAEEVAQPGAKMLQHLRVAIGDERPHEAVGRHVAGELVVVPEQPAQELELLLLRLAAEAAISVGKAEQDRRS